MGRLYQHQQNQRFVLISNMKKILSIFLILIICLFLYQSARAETFGYTTLGITNGSGNGSWIYCSNLNTTASISGDVDSITAAFDGGGSVKGIILDSSFNILTNGITPAQSSASGWVDLPYSTKPSVVSGNTYYPCVIHTGVSQMKYDGLISNTSRYDSTNNYATPQNAGCMTLSNVRISLYATYTAGGAVATSTTEITGDVIIQGDISIQ